MWSATADSIIDEGKKVIITSSEGVHIKVKEI
jgi:membrane protein implicated in regulation of membrane protease activity